MKKLVLATGNKGKVTELANLLLPLGFDVIPQTQLQVPDADETGLSFIENAILKARHAAALTGLPALADDSGLAVDALGGAPGIYSARYAGVHGNDQANIELLLQNLAEVAAPSRTAQFHCVLAFVRHANDPTPLIAHGIWHGEISNSAQGDGGFGYDPVFFVPALGQTAAQLTKEQKAAISHRGKALQQLAAQLRAQVGSL